MQTYQQCPECPVLSVPVPVPKFPNTLAVVENKNSDKSLIGKLADIVRPVISRARNFFKGVSDPEADKITSRIDTVEPAPAVAPNNNRLTAPIFASLAAVGLGLASYFSSNLAGGR